MDLLKMIKMLLGATIAILIAKYLGIENEFSLALITLLSLAETKKTTIKLAFKRIASTFVGLIISTAIFYIFDFSLSAVLIILIIYIPISMKLDIMIGLIPSMVLIGHIMAKQDISMDVLLNELLIMAIAVFIASILNLYMKSYQREISEIKLEIERDIAKVFSMFYFKLTPYERSISKNDDIVSGDTRIILYNIEEKISILNEYVVKEKENTLFSINIYNSKYIKLRSGQLNLLKYMDRSLGMLKVNLEERKVIAIFFYLTSKQVSEKNPCKYLLKDLEKLQQQFKEGKLPETREEFEDRAVLYKLLTDFRRYLEIKKKFIEETENL